MIRFREISKLVGGREVLNDFNLGIEEGESVSLFGPNGCGKSTLLRIIVGLDVDFVGRIEDRQHLLNDLSYVPQAHKASLLPWKSARDNILLALEIKGISDDGALDKLLEVYPVAFDMNTKAKNLSGGEAQKVCILRALITNPKFLVLDEPTSNLDYLAVGEFIEAISRIRKEWGMTVLSVVHDPEQAKRLGDRVVEMGRCLGSYEV